MALFRAYFRDGRDIGDLATLADIGAEIGMQRRVVARLLSSDADLAEIRARDKNSRARGINAVPTFIVAETYVLQGAQQAETWERLMDDLSESVGSKH